MVTNFSQKYSSCNPQKYAISGHTSPKSSKFEMHVFLWISVPVRYLKSLWRSERKSKASLWRIYVKIVKKSDGLWSFECFPSSRIIQATMEVLSSSTTSSQREGPPEPPETSSSALVQQLLNSEPPLSVVQPRPPVGPTGQQQQVSPVQTSTPKPTPKKEKSQPPPSSSPENEPLVTSCKKKKKSIVKGTQDSTATFL